MEDVMRSMRNEMNRLRGARGMPKLVIEPRQRTFTPQITLPDPSSQRVMLSPVPEPPSVPPSEQRQILECPICPDPDPDCPCQRTQVPTGRQMNSMATFTLAAQTIAHDGSACGLCQSNAECLCRVVEEPSREEAKSSCGLCTSSTFCACHDKDDTVTSAPSTSHEALPLRRRPRSSGARNLVWSIDTPASGSRADEAVCSGDPSSCDACRNDAFGMSHLIQSSTGLTSP